MAHVVSKSEMQHVIVDELRQMASNYRESIWAQAQSVGREPKIIGVTSPVRRLIRLKVLPAKSTSMVCAITAVKCAVS